MIMKSKHFVDNDGSYICCDVNSELYGRNVKVFYCKNLQERKGMYRIISYFIVMVLLFISINPVDGYNSHNFEMMYVRRQPPKVVVPEFSMKELVKQISLIDTHYVKLCLAQCDWESGLGTSQMFLEAHNLFGICVAKESEPHIRVVDKDGYVHLFKIYKDWVESLHAWYSLVSYYQDAAMIEFMSKYYCTDPNYSYNLMQCYKKYKNVR